MRTVVGLFEDKNEARRTIDDLKRIGISESAVSLLSKEGANGPMAAYLDPSRASRDPAGVTRALVAMGLSEGEAQKYVSGIEHGYTLEAVSVDDAKANEALEIMRAHWGNAPDREARGIGGIEREDIGETEEIVPVIVEELAIGKREVAAGGVRVVSKVESAPVEQDVSLRTEKVDVERRKVDRPIEKGEDAFREREIEVTATAEEAVVAKTARVIEEVIVKKDVETHTEKIKDTVRHTDVDVEKLPFDAGAYRKHHASTLAEGGKFDEFEPAYRYGHEMRTSGGAEEAKDWSTVESDAKSGWEEKNPNSWERFKGAIRHAWERATK